MWFITESVDIMKKLSFIVVILLAAGSAFGQAKFPGVSAVQAKQLRTIKRSLAFPLPTWVPAGFKMIEIESKLGRKVPVYERVFNVWYVRQLSNGAIQQFGIIAGFDGIGDLMYEPLKDLRTPLGTITMVYEPKDEDNGGKRIKNFSMTEWFEVGKTAFRYDGGFEGEVSTSKRRMISIADTEKILRSLRRY